MCTAQYYQQYIVVLLYVVLLTIGQAVLNAFVPQLVDGEGRLFAGFFPLSRR